MTVMGARAQTAGMQAGFLGIKDSWGKECNPNRCQREMGYELSQGY